MNAEPESLCRTCKARKAYIYGGRCLSCHARFLAWLGGYEGPEVYRPRTDGLKEEETDD